ncbi:uncharacterized protein LOC128215452 [Mya arenaria]|uniref:uncharacterized protein LOC128215452 n=1 Tax=Mya arenaria TaxID=6604 RepID=UPI0022E9679D|nr:uncharacterized protein LOC128215452 [Mya arenaria]
MATGDSSIYKGSDLIHDFSCSKCEEDNLNTEAQHFCPQCEHYLCAKCVNMHNGYHKAHIVYGREDIQKWAGFSMNKCDQHGNKLEASCDDDQELCCSVCVALNHRQCSSISHLPDLAKGFLKTADFIQLPAAVDEMRSRLDELKSTRTKDQTSLKDSYRNVLAEIKALRKKIDQILDQLEKKTIEQLDSLMEDLEKSQEEDLDMCADMQDRLKTLIDKLQQATGKHKEINSYIGFTKCQTKLNEAKTVVQEIQRRPKECIRFNSDESVKPFLKIFNHIGYVDSVYSIPKKTDVGHVYNAQSSTFYSVKIEKDPYCCNIVGICVLPSGDLVIVDRNNKRVKLLNEQYKVIGHCDFPTPPQHLLHTAGEEIAVAVSYGFLNEVHFLTVTRGQLQPGRKFTIDHKCYSIAHHQGQLYVGSSDTLYQYTIDGQMIRKIYEYSSHPFSEFMCAVSPDGERIYVTTSDKSELITLDKGGQVLSTLKDPDLRAPNGVCVSPIGHVFVCGFESHTVLQVDREGRKKLATVARKADRLRHPLSVCFSERTSCLIIGNNDSNNITVVKLY